MFLDISQRRVESVQTALEAHGKKKNVVRDFEIFLNKTQRH